MDTGYKMKTACGHHFHGGCFITWMENEDNSSKCPLCRSNSTPVLYSPISVGDEHDDSNRWYFYAAYKSYPKTSKTKPIDFKHNNIYSMKRECGQGLELHSY